MTKLSEAWTVRRTIRIPRLINAEDEYAIKQALRSLPGMINIKTNTKRMKITVNYDASQLNYKTITKVLIKIGMPTLNNWWSRFKGSCYHYTDSNARDNANAPAPACCNKPPRNL